MHSETAGCRLGLCSGTSTCYTSHPLFSESFVPMLPSPDPHQLAKQNNQEPSIVPNKHQLVEPNLGGITTNAPLAKRAPKHRQGQKRKATSLPDTPPQEVGNSASQGLRFRPLAKRPTPVPKQPNHIEPRSSPLGAANSSGYSAGAETPRASPFQPAITPVRVKSTHGAGLESSQHMHLPTGNALSGSILIHGDTGTSDGLAGGQDGLLDLNCLEPYGWGVLSSVNYPTQASNLGYAGPTASISSAQEHAIPFGGQQPNQQWTGWTGSAGPHSATYAWHSHLEGIMSLGMAISRISRKLKSAKIQPLCDVDVETLLEQSEHLQQSYFRLKKCVQQSMPSPGGPNVG